MSGKHTFRAALLYSRQREYVRWIEEARREEKRRARIAKAAAMLAKGKKPC